ncbi:helix-turn-helix domain-containing protein [Micromonospora globispora]|uniref:helix-turn-helix domain-containing protein n=1 Tax=Micromonospora globispora TaxID=1450148 RepID=UPI001A9C47DC
MQLRYNYRVYPTRDQLQALARTFGCARLVFNDGLRARHEAHAQGLPYLSDGELSKRVITQAKTTPERASFRGVRGCAPTGPRGSELGLPQLLQLAVWQAQGRQDRAAEVSVTEGQSAGDSFHQERPVRGAGQRASPSAEDRCPAGAVVTATTG